MIEFWCLMIPKGHLSLIDYFWLFLPMIVNFWLSFDVCFLFEFWLSLIIMIDSYVDCLWWLFLIEFLLSLMIVFECYVDYWLFFMIFLLYYIFWLFILDMYFFGCKIVCFNVFWYYLILIYSNKREIFFWAKKWHLDISKPL